MYDDGIIRAKCSSPKGSVATGFQVIAQLSNSSAARKVYVNKSMDFEIPVIMQVEESGTWHVAVFEIKGGVGILNSTVQRYNVITEPKENAGACQHVQYVRVVFIIRWFFPAKKSSELYRSEESAQICAHQWENVPS